MTAHSVLLENDEGHYSLIIEDDLGSHIFAVNPQDVLDAVAGYRAHLAEGEAVRAERAAAGGISWAAYTEARERTDSDWDQNLAELGDHLRKQERENS